MTEQIALLRQVVRECVESSGADTQIVACAEKLGARPTDGRVQAFTFGELSGMTQGVMAALGVPLHLVHPLRWKNALMGARHRPKEWTQSQRSKAAKLESLVKARELFPHLTITKDGVADALLLAFYGAHYIWGQPVGLDTI